MSDIQLSFDFDGEILPVYLSDDGHIWIHATTVCKVLELSNPAVTLKRHVKLKYRKQIAVGVGMPAWYLLEPGFYQLVFRSKVDKAEKFQDWIFEEVLPSIRRDGGYISPEATTEQLEVLQSQIDIQQNMTLQMGRDLTELTSKKKEYETKVNDWETDIKNDIDGDPMTYYKFLKNERKEYMELEAKVKQLEGTLETKTKQLDGIKEVVSRKYPPTKAQIVEFILEGSY
jgi:prophage antirepressor-like protein